MTSFISRALMAACMAAVPVVALAADADGNVKQIAVHYQDLNLTQKSGAEILIARIEEASKQACGGTPDIRDLKMREFFGRCMKATVDHAVASVDSPLVAAVYNGTASQDVKVSQR